MKPEGPPRVGFRLALRALLAGLLVTVITAAAVATAALRELDDILDPIRQPGRADIRIPELDTPPPGGPRTFMILGSDKREGADRLSPPRSDTILLVRADPDAEAVTVTSIPRDLKVDVPGHGQNKINAAFELGGRKGGPGLVVKTIKKLFKDKIGQDLPITNVMVMDYGAFRRAVNYIDGVYVDVDRHYFNDNSSGENYATIDVDAGYQKLMGKDALDYVRYRHGDNDIVRGARQQDFLRQAKAQIGAKQIFEKRDRLLKVFAAYTQTDKSLQDAKPLLDLGQLAFLSAGHPVREIKFPAIVPDSPTAAYVGYSQGRLPGAVDQFLSGRTATSSSGASRPSRRRSSRPHKSKPVQLDAAQTKGEDQAIVASRGTPFPVYFPTKVGPGGTYQGPGRPYRLRTLDGSKRRAYVMVVQLPGVGEYYDVEGMNWTNPPLLQKPDARRRIGPHTYSLYFDGSKLRLVAFRAGNAVYWVTNTLTRSLTNKQMLAIAASMRPLGHG